MARRRLSVQGRLLAAGVSVALGGALVGVMAAGDHAADAASTNTPSTNTPSTNTPSVSGDGSGTTATPNDDRGFPTGSSGFPVQPQTRTGGS
jgi:hypothetical protein